MKLLLVRHGQTIWNTELRTQGHTDIPLDDVGQMQALRLAQRLGQTHIDAVYTSPLQRARDTAHAIADTRSIAVKVHPLLMERNFGIWEGELFKSLMEKYPDDIRKWEADPVAFTPPQAEPLNDVLSRCVSLLNELQAAHEKEETVLVVGHSIPLRLIVAHLIGLSPARILSLRIDNAAYTELRLGKNYPILTVLNDTSHLG